MFVVLLLLSSFDFEFAGRLPASLSNPATLELAHGNPQRHRDSIHIVVEKFTKSAIEIHVFHQKHIWFRILKCEENWCRKALPRSLSCQEGLLSALCVPGGWFLAGGCVTGGWFLAGVAARKRGPGSGNSARKLLPGSQMLPGGPSRQQRAAKSLLTSLSVNKLHLAIGFVVSFFVCICACSPRGNLAVVIIKMKI